MESVLALDVNINNDEYYNIWCESYLADFEAQLYKNSIDENNLVRTTFSYYIDYYGWGVGECSPIYTYDIKNMYKSLCLLKTGCIDKLSCTFKSEEFHAGYYFKIIILAKFNEHYNAYFNIKDDIGCVEFWKSFSENELDEQIKKWKKCAEAFPVRDKEDVNLACYNKTL